VATQDLDQEVRGSVADRAEYERLVGRLSKASVDKHYEPYVDIAWDDPGMQIDPHDPRWILSPDLDPLGAHPWYQALPPETQARLGLWRVATAMKTGVEFENLLKRGLLAYAFWLPNGSAEFRYAYHEVVEEGHHGMMFQEFVNRTGLPIRGVPNGLRQTAQLIPALGIAFPELFFFFVLGGEDPIDYVQRRTLGAGVEVHPLLERIMRIHVAEESRHLSFARHYLRRRIPKLGPVRRSIISVAIPMILFRMSRVMLGAAGPMVREFGIPEDVVREAYRSPAARAERRASLAKVRELAVELGLARPALWKALGLWPQRGDARASAGSAA
jgi:P-aminobenzoate N-oxygenase AurF